MKSDIPKLMQERRLDAIIVQGDTDTSSDLAYLTGGIHLERAMYLQTPEGQPVLFASPIERENAAETGLPIRLWSDYDIFGYLRTHANDRLAATVALLSDILRDQDIQGRVGFYGFADQGYSYIFLNALAAANPQIEIVGEVQPNLFSIARQTKDAAELAAMKRVAGLTTEVIDSVFAFIQSHGVENETITKQDGSPLTIGDIKAHIRLEIAKRNLEEVHENIFSQGRDAGVPHNRGQLDMPLRLGQSIIFDIFPRDRTTGYFHDITRTFFLGYAPDDLAQRWQQIKIIFDELLDSIQVGEPCSLYQHLTCDYFEALGYPTLRNDPKTKVGYNHSLGHGVGLDIHEGPGLSHLPDNTTVLQPGHVVSVEPGLYYPDDGWGIRIEDTIAFDEQGKLVNLSDYPYEMVIPVG